MAKSRANQPACALCEHARTLDVPHACLCEKRGVVRADGCCRKFSPDLLKLQPDARRSVPLPKDLDFSI